MIYRQRPQEGAGRQQSLLEKRLWKSGEVKSQAFHLGVYSNNKDEGTVEATLLCLPIAVSAARCVCSLCRGYLPILRVHLTSRVHHLPAQKPLILLTTANLPKCERIRVLYSYSFT